MTQIYQNNSPVFIKVLNKKGVVKDYDSTLDQYFITYFNSKDKRDSNWFTTNQLAEFKNKDTHARSSNGDKLLRFDTVVKNNPDKFKEINQWFDKWNNDGNICNKYEDKLLDKINEIESSNKSESYKKLAILSVKEELMDYVKSGRPFLKGHKPNHINIIKPDSEKVNWVTRKVGDKEVEGFLPLHPATREEEYINHVKSLEKLVEGYKLVLSNLQNEQDSFKMVREFQKTFNLPAPDVPTVLSETTVINRSGWLVEEVLELLWSTADNKDQFTSMYGELLIRMDKDFNKLFNKPFEPHNKLINQADALTDIDYFNLGTFVELGIVPNSLTRIVHSANMAKLHNGKVVYNENNKVVKPDGWIAPEPLIEKEIERQVELGVKRFK